MAETADKDLYERDFYAWTQDQARRLRALRGHNSIDVDHLAEEIEALGRSERRGFRRNLMRALQHIIQATVAISDEPRRKWLGEVRDHLVDARTLLADSPRLAGEVHLAGVWADAVREANAKLRLHGDPEFPAGIACPFRIDALTQSDFDPEAAVATLTRVLDGNGDPSAT